MGVHARCSDGPACVTDDSFSVSKKAPWSRHHVAYSWKVRQRLTMANCQLTVLRQQVSKCVYYRGL